MMKSTEVDKVTKVTKINNHTSLYHSFAGGAIVHPTSLVAFSAIL
jgi:hypothetical protein